MTTLVKITTLIALVLTACQVTGQTLSIDLGLFPAEPCLRPTLSGAPSQVNRHGQRLVAVTATIFFEPPNVRTLTAAELCSKRVATELEASRSSSNLGLFGEVFQQGLEQCVRGMTPDVRVLRSVVKRKETCE